MRRSLSILIFLLCALPMSAQTTKFVQYLGISETTSPSSGSPFTAAPLTNIKAGDTLIAIFALNSPIATTTQATPTDTFNLTWTQIQVPTNTSTAGGQYAAWCATVGTNQGSDALTFSWSPTTSLFYRGFVIEYAGVSCTKDVGTTAAGGSASCNAGPVTTTIPGDLLLTFAYQPGATGTAWTAGGSWTRESLSTALRTIFADQQNVATGAYTGNLSWTTGASNGCFIVALKPAAALGTTVIGPTTIAGPAVIH